MAPKTGSADVWADGQGDCLQVTGGQCSLATGLDEAKRETSRLRPMAPKKQGVHGWQGMGAAMPWGMDAGQVFHPVLYLG